jgi:SWI/SNF-related matrix-associated actin-dependent regulator 1 of chromatin subfamily A
MLDELFGYQEYGAKWLAGKRQAYLCDVMGLGKSAQLVRACDLVGATSILVVCPAAARVNWTREFQRFSPLDRKHAAILAGTDADNIDSAEVVAVSYDILANKAVLKRLTQRKWDVLILDEAHFLKDRRALRTKAVYGKLAPLANYVWRASGTPAPNNVAELWTSLRSAQITQLGHTEFTQRYCTGFESSYGFKITGTKNETELKALLALFMLRRTKSQVMTQLPPLVFKHVTVARSPVDLDPWFFEQYHRLDPDANIAQRKLVEKISADSSLVKQSIAAIANRPVPGGRPECYELNTQNDDTLRTLESLGASLPTLRRYIGLAKVPEIAAIIANELETDQYDKIVLMCVHMHVIEQVRIKLKKFHPVTLYGGTPATKRQQNIDRFQKDKSCRVFIGQVVAAGTAITLTAASELAFVEQSWVPAENAQAAMRVHRIGQTRSVRVRVFSCDNTIDEQVNNVLIRKQRELAKVDLV